MSAPTFENMNDRIRRIVGELAGGNADRMIAVASAAPVPSQDWFFAPPVSGQSAPKTPPQNGRRNG